MKHIINNGEIVKLTKYEEIEIEEQEAKGLKEAYEAILEDVTSAFFEEDEDTNRYAMLAYLEDLIVFDLSEPEHRLPSLMQSTVEEIEAEYKESIALYPEIEAFIDRIRVLYS